MTTVSWPLFPESDVKAALLGKNGHVFKVQDGDNEMIVIVYQEEGMEFGEHATMRTCDCESDECKHVNAAMSQVITCTFTFNDD